MLAYSSAIQAKKWTIQAGLIEFIIGRESPDSLLQFVFETMRF